MVECPMATLFQRHSDEECRAVLGKYRLFILRKKINNKRIANVSKSGRMAVKDLCKQSYKFYKRHAIIKKPSFFPIWSTFKLLLMLFTVEANSKLNLCLLDV